MLEEGRDVKSGRSVTKLFVCVRMVVHYVEREVKEKIEM